MLLHTVNKSPWSHAALRDCLQVINNGDALLLLEDGAYGASRTSVLAAKLRELAEEHQVRIYVIEADLSARGLSDLLLAGVEPTDYDGFVALATESRATQSWY